MKKPQQHNMEHNGYRHTQLCRRLRENKYHIGPQQISVSATHIPAPVPLTLQHTNTLSN